MYRAIIEVGGYKVGDEVPTDKAEHWLKVFAVPHVEKISEDATGQDSESEPEKKPSKDVMLEDYLGRNTSVVKKNVEGDDLSQEEVKGLLKLEKSGKNRAIVIEALERK